MIGASLKEFGVGDKITFSTRIHKDAQGTVLAINPDAVYPLRIEFSTDVIAKVQSVFHPDEFI